MTAPTGAAGVRLTWVQPEDLIGHELRQAAQDGRDATRVAHRWQEAGGHPCPPRAGASAAPSSPRLRALAEDLLDELAALPCPLAADEPTDLAAIEAASGARPGDGRAARAAGPGGSGRGPGGRRSRPDVPGPVGSGPVDLKYGRGILEGGEGPGASGRGPGARPGAGSPADGAAGGGRGEAVAGSVGPSGSPLRAGQVHAAWLGRAVGCLLGKPVEKLPLDGIRALAAATGNWPLHTWFTARGLPAELAAAYPWNRRSAGTSLAENIDGMPEDDDLNYPLLNLLLLQRYGRGFTTAQVAQLWLDELPAGRTFTAERVAYRNLLCGIEPPHTARHRNPFREWIGAAIRADLHGWTNPGDPRAAAAQAHRDAVLTHTANGVYSAMFVAATVAEAARTPDVHACLRAGLGVIPPRSRLADAVRLGVAVAGEHDDFETVVDLLHAALGHYHWVHAVPNAALLAAALTHADGDFAGSVCRAVSGGWDTDSNGATAGSVAGLLAGSPAGLPDRWTAPLRNRLATSVGGFDGVGFDVLAELTLAESVRAAGEGTVHGPVRDGTAPTASTPEEALHP